MASAPVPTVNPANLGQIVSGGLWQGLAYAGQFLLPFICLIAALASVLRQRKQRQPLSQTVARLWPAT